MMRQSGGGPQHKKTHGVEGMMSLLKNFPVHQGSEHCSSDRVSSPTGRGLVRQEWHGCTLHYQFGFLHHQFGTGSGPRRPAGGIVGQACRELSTLLAEWRVGC
jgi:hypothetical protein